VLGGPIGWAAGAAVGAGAGAIGAKVVDLGISDEWVEWFRATVEPGSTIVAVLVDDVNRDALVAEAARFPGAEVVSTSLDSATLARLREAVGQDTGTAEPDEAPEPSA
ncbi:MAG: DUF1269 domain-containing protein, partial [Actinobacteria bacterium]|nr:DUF1269 domain-containing protein [Actinomycetota bacterium]